MINGELIFVDDDVTAGQLFARYCLREKIEVKVFDDAILALEYCSKNQVSAVISDFNMPQINGIELLQQLKAKKPDLPFIMITGFGTVDNAVAALRLGAADFIKKPYEIPELIEKVDAVVDSQLSTQVSSSVLETKAPASDQLLITATSIGQSKAIQGVYDTINRIKDVRVSVMIEGESGTGKELAARAVHQVSDFVDSPFIVIDCGALSDTLLESELFGHEKGAFTGALQDKKGLLEVASGGTMFLDEIGNISDSMQTKLLRAVQGGQITRVGGVTPIQIDVRFIVASNRDLVQMVNEGTFRHDLYHRLNVVKIKLPPLREREGDVPLLVNAFVAEFAKRYGRLATHFDEASMRQLNDYAWPGNIRELRNLVEQHVALSEDEVMSIQSPLLGVTAPISGNAPYIDEEMPTLAELEQRYILKVLEHHRGSREKTANTLGINKSTLWRKLQSYSGYSRS